VQQAVYAQINQRFTLRCKLSNDDIGTVVEERLLRKNQTDLSKLTARFQQDAGLLADLGTLANPTRVYPAPTIETFGLFYPYLPWTVAAIPDMVRGIARSASRSDELTGSTRTLIGVVQGQSSIRPACSGRRWVG